MYFEINIKSKTIEAVDPENVMNLHSKDGRVNIDFWNDEMTLTTTLWLPVPDSIRDSNAKELPATSPELLYLKKMLHALIKFLIMIRTVSKLQVFPKLYVNDIVRKQVS